MEICYEINVETANTLHDILLKHKIFENFVSGSLSRYILKALYVGTQ